LRSIEFLDLTLVEYYNTIAVEDRVDTVRNCKWGIGLVTDHFRRI
jgi:hypothetical protein